MTKVPKVKDFNHLYLIEKNSILNSDASGVRMFFSENIGSSGNTCLKVLGIVTKKQALPDYIITLADIDLPPIPDKPEKFEVI